MLKKIVVVTMLMLLCAGIACGDSGLMIGKVVDSTYPVIVDGTQLATDAIVIDGVSYEPTRVVAEALGATTGFVDDKIILTKEGHAVADTTTTSAIIRDDVQSYKVKSITDAFKVGGGDTEQDYIEKNGDQYLPLVVFAHYTEYIMPVATVSVPGYPVITVQDNQEYNLGCEGFMYKGRMFIKLSSVGLKAEVKDGYLWLEKI